MKLVAADWLPYTLPLKHPWQTSQGKIGERRGRLLRLQSTDGLAGWGDAAPLPEFGITDQEAQAFAEETAYLDLLAQQAGLPLHQWLSGAGPVSSLAVNASLGALSEVTPGMLAAAVAAGFSTVKLKVGTRPLADEIVQLRKLAEACPPNLKFRLDANRAWRLSEAVSFIAAGAHLPIEGLEEPLADPDSGSLANLQSMAHFPLAIDESTHLIDAAFFQHPPIRRIVIKPARLGGLLASVEMALRAKASGMKVIITSSLESACGLLACAHLAAAVAPDAIHGLGTGECFVADTGPSPAISAGRLHLPTNPGLGFRPATAFGQ